MKKLHANRKSQQSEDWHPPHVDSQEYLSSCINDIISDFFESEPDLTVEDLDIAMEDLEFQISTLLKVAPPDDYPDDDFSYVWEYDIPEWVIDKAVEMKAWGERIESLNIPWDECTPPELNSWGAIEPDKREISNKAIDRAIEEGIYEDSEYQNEVFPYIKDLEGRAFSAIQSRDLDEYLNILEQLNDLREELKISSWEDITLENWIEVIDYPVDNNIDDDGTNVEATIIRLITDLSISLCNLIANDSEALRYIEWRQLEQIIATALSGIGFEVILTPSSKDGGKDVIAKCYLNGKGQTFFIELKHWRSGKKVNSVPIFDFVEINLHKKTTAGLFLSTSGYTNEVYSHCAELSRRHIALGEENKVVSLCQHFIRKGSGIWTSATPLPEILFEKTFPDINSYLANQILEVATFHKRAKAKID